MNLPPKNNIIPSDDELARIELLKKKLYSKNIPVGAAREHGLNQHSLNVGKNWEETDEKIAKEEALKKKIEEEAKAGVDVEAMYGSPVSGTYGHYSEAEELAKNKKRASQIKTNITPGTKGEKRVDGPNSVGAFLSDKFATERAEKIQKKVAAEGVTLKYAAAQVQKSIYPNFSHERQNKAGQAANTPGSEVTPAPVEAERYHPDIRVLTVGQTRLDDLDFKVKHTGDPNQPKEETVSKSEAEMLQAQRKEKVKRFSFGTILFTLVTLFFVGALGYAYIQFQNGSNVISPDKIEINVIGPVSVQSGAVSDFVVDIINHNSADLIQSDLVIQFPEGTKDPFDTARTLNNLRLDVGTVKAGQTSRQKVSAVFFGEENVKKNVRYSFEFNIEESTSIFNKEKVIGIFIASSPVTAKITNVKEITNNQELTFDIEIISNSQETVKNVQLKVEYPFGYKLLQANVKPVANNNIWNIGDIEPLGARTITLKGVLIGTNNLEKNFRFTLGIADQKTGEMATVLATQDQKVFIRQPFVSASLTLDGSGEGAKIVRYEDQVQGNISFTNNLKNPLTDVVVEMRLAGVLINRQGVQANQGFYRSQDDIIFWDKAQNDALADVGPGETRELSFGLEIIEGREDLIKILRRSSSSLVITIKAKRLNENNVPEEIVYNTSRELRLETDLSLESYVQHVSGPTPVSANQESVLRYTGRIRNTANAVKTTMFVAKLPPNAVWKNSYSTNLPATGVKYSPSKRELTIEMGEIPSGVGIDKPVIDFYFDFGFTPSLTQVDTSPKVILNPRISGVDTFTERRVESGVDALDTSGVGGPVVE